MPTIIWQEDRITKKLFTVIWSQITVFYINHRKPNNLYNSKVTKYAPIMLLTKMSPKRSFLVIKKENLVKNNFVYFLTKSTFSTDYHKNHKTQNNQRLNSSTKMISRQNTVWYIHFNMQWMQNHKKIIYCDFSPNHSFLH